MERSYSEYTRIWRKMASRGLALVILLLALKRGPFWGEWRNKLDFNVLFVYVCSIAVFDFRFQGTCPQAQTKVKPTVSVRQAQNVLHART